MQKTLGYLISFLAGGVLTFFVIRNFPMKSEMAQKAAEQPANQQIADACKPEVAVKPRFSYLGIQPGDLLISVNGIKSPSMLQEVAKAYRRGDVCVVLERNEEGHELCFTRIPSYRKIASSNKFKSLEESTDKPEVEPPLPYLDPESGEVLGRLKPKPTTDDSNEH